MFVAPYVGEWIETNQIDVSSDTGMSHPTWVRGLKLMRQGGDKYNYWSHPTWVRGLKQNTPYHINEPCCRTLRGCVD